MTQIDSEQIKCLKCGCNFSAIMHNSVNVTMAPHLKEEFLSGKLNNAVCPECNTIYNIEGVVLYHDTDNRIMTQVLLSEEYSNNKEEAIKEFTEMMMNMVSSLNSFMRRNFEAYKFNVVFSIDELKESLEGNNEICNEKTRKITKDVLDIKHKNKESVGIMEKIGKWFRRFITTKNITDDTKHKEDSVLSDKYVVIAGEKISLKYFPELAKLADVEPDGLADTISSIMNKNNVDVKNAMIIFEKLAKRISEKIDEKIIE
jgi:hypothetical protein